MSNIEDRYPICPEEDDIYRPYVEELLGIKMDNATFEKIAWHIVDQWYDHVEEGPPERQQMLRDNRLLNTKYTAFLLRHDLDRAKAGSPYPRPTTERMKKVWPLAQELYYIEDPSGFLGPALGETFLVARAVVLASKIMDTGFEPELIKKLESASIHPWGDPRENDPEFAAWLDNNGIYNMFEHRGSEMIWDE